MKNPFYSLKNKLLALDLEKTRMPHNVEYGTTEDLADAINLMGQHEMPSHHHSNMSGQVRQNATLDTSKIQAALRMGFMNDLSKSFANIAFTKAVNATLEELGILQANMDMVEKNIVRVQQESFASFFEKNHISSDSYSCQVHPNYFLNLFYEKFKELQMPSLDDLLKKTVSVQCDVTFVLFADNSILTRITIEDKDFLTSLREILACNFQRMNDFIQHNSQRVQDYYMKSQIEHEADAKTEVERVSAFYKMAFATIFRSVEHNQFINIDDTKIYCNLIQPQEGEMLDILLKLKNPNTYPLITA